MSYKQVYFGIYNHYTQLFYYGQSKDDTKMVGKDVGMKNVKCVKMRYSQLMPDIIVNPAVLYNKLDTVAITGPVKGFPATISYSKDKFIEEVPDNYLGVQLKTEDGSLQQFVDTMFGKASKIKINIKYSYYTIRCDASTKEESNKILKKGLFVLNNLRNLRNINMAEDYQDSTNQVVLSKAFNLTMAAKMAGKQTDPDIIPQLDDKQLQAQLKNIITLQKSIVKTNAVQFYEDKFVLQKGDGTNINDVLSFDQKLKQATSLQQYIGFSNNIYVPAENQSLIIFFYSLYQIHMKMKKDASLMVIKDDINYNASLTQVNDSFAKFMTDFYASPQDYCEQLKYVTPYFKKLIPDLDCIKMPEQQTDYMWMLIGGGSALALSGTAYYLYKKTSYLDFMKGKQQRNGKSDKKSK